MRGIHNAVDGVMKCEQSRRKDKTYSPFGPLGLECVHSKGQESFRRFLWESALELGSDEAKAGLLKETAELVILPTSSRQSNLQVYFLASQGPLPRHTAIRLVEIINTAGAQILLDDDEALLWHQCRLAAPQVLDELLVGQMPNAPLHPNEVILDAIWRRPLLEAHGEYATNARCIV